MEFTLYIKDKVKSDDAQSKREVRLQFHKQLKLLWQLDAWKNNNSSDWMEVGNKLYVQKPGKNFVCLVRKTLDMYVELQFNFYLPMNTSFRDIDNKLKTFCDALQLPSESDALDIVEDPFICLLENDELIYKLTADTDFILDIKDDDESFFNGRHDMLCIINVKIKGNRFIEGYNDLII
jgi:Holliday junction resolvase RusA-like endonuclease